MYAFDLISTGNGTTAIALNCCTISTCPKKIAKTLHKLKSIL